jgi:hypothetical protein
MGVKASSSHDHRISMSTGAVSQDNWLAAIKGEPIQETMEWPLFTDARLTGEARGNLGPYAFLNMVAAQHRFGVARPASILRIDFHLAADHLPDMSATDPGQYHGGTFADEMAALASLVLGIRMKAGGASRTFGVTGDPKGRPIGWDFRLDPELHAGPNGRVIPKAAGQRKLNSLDVLAALPKVQGADAIAFIRAARLYQEALWVSESEPNLAWLLIVSSVESAANQWRRNKAPAVDRLAAEKPDLVEYLRECQVDGLIDRIAKEFASTLGSTKKFVDFLLEHLPSPPTERPQWGRLSWERAELKKVLSLVYAYRSKALHEGVPFPAPMCEPPAAIPDSNAPSEIPIGLATSTLGGVWKAEDTPILLHVFEHIARNAILSWWRSLDTPTAF